MSAQKDWWKKLASPQNPLSEVDKRFMTQKMLDDYYAQRPTLSLPYWINPLIQKSRIVGGIIAAISILGAVALNPHARPEFRMVAATLLVMAVIGAIGWTLKTYTIERIALCLFIVGVIALCIGGFGGWFGALPSRIYVWMCLGGGVVGLIGLGLVDGVFFPTPEPPSAPAQSPLRQTVYGDARTATDWEIHEALRDKNPQPNNSGYRYED